MLAEDAAPCAGALASCEDDASYGGADNHRDPGLYWDWTGYLAGIAPPSYHAAPVEAPVEAPVAPPVVSEPD